MSVQKKKRISKRTKSAWRKTDVQDVEEFLEEQRQEERIGDVSGKKDEELFTVDTGDLEPATRRLTEKQKRKLNAQRPLRALQSLINTSKVEDPIVKRNHVKPMKSGRVIEEEIRNPCKPWHFQANKDRLRHYEQFEKKVKDRFDQKFSKDIWEDGPDLPSEFSVLKNEKQWISKDLALHIVKNIGKPVVKVHDSLRHRTTKAKDSDLPHAGSSYNPSLQDHTNLLRKIVHREEEIIKEAEHLKRVTTNMFMKVTPQERDDLYRKEMECEDVMENKQCGMDKQEEDGETHEGDAADSYRAVNAPVENRKKSRQTRQKALRQKNLRKRTLEKRALKKQMADLARIKIIKSEVVAENESLKALRKHRKKVALKKKYEPKRLGRLKFVEPDDAVNMVEDLSGNLRNVKTECSLLIDRVKSFQRRNIMAVSVYAGKQKARKVKKYVRNSHKEPGVSYDMLRERRKAAPSGQIKI